MEECGEWYRGRKAFAMCNCFIWSFLSSIFSFMLVSLIPISICRGESTMILYNFDRIWWLIKFQWKFGFISKMILQVFLADKFCGIYRTGNMDLYSEICNYFPFITQQQIPAQHHRMLCCWFSCICGSFFRLLGCFKTKPVIFVIGWYSFIVYVFLKCYPRIYMLSVFRVS